jgi:hypothetical protein
MAGPSIPGMILPVRTVRRCLVAAVLSLSALAGAAPRTIRAQEIPSDQIRVAIACQADAETASVDRFARWAPQRCAALSLHSTDRWTWFDWTPGLQSLESLRGVPCLATTGAHDVARRDAAAQWVTMARGAGLPVTWQELPGVGHYPTPEMEELSRAFLAQNAGRTRSHSGNGQSPKSDPLPAHALATE